MIVMDCDLQHPPEVIPQMWEKWQQGAEIVEGIKSDRGRESLGYKLSAGLFYKIMSKLILNCWTERWSGSCWNCRSAIPFSGH